MIRVLRNIVAVGFRLFLSRLRLAEEQIETVSERELFVLRLGERQKERIAQDGPVGEADLRDRTHRIDAFGRRDMDAGAPCGTEETMDILAHRGQPKTLDRAALAMKVVI
ncbi:hypothetical protein ACVWZK_003888 [Bradyrhizobium sp. GM0.4]